MAVEQWYSIIHPSDRSITEPARNITSARNSALTYGTTPSTGAAPLSPPELTDDMESLSWRDMVKHTMMDQFDFDEEDFPGKENDTNQVSFPPEFGNFFDVYKRSIYDYWFDSLITLN